MDDDAAGRATRRRIIIGITVALIAVWAALAVIGGRSVDAEISAIRSNASTAVIDQSEMIGSLYDRSIDPIAVALDESPRSVVQTADGWCAVIEVSRVLSTRSLRFVIDADGAFVEVDGC